MIDDILYTFDVYGLYNGLFVMADRQTGSIWNHFDGAVLTGPLIETDIQLEIQPLLHLTWGEWKSLHPNTLALPWFPEFASRYFKTVPGSSWLGPQFQQTILNRDDRLPENELVLGANLGDDFRAYQLDIFPTGLTVINDTLDGKPVLILINSDEVFGLAFEAQLNGKILQFHIEDDQIVDQSGNIWGIDGRSNNGLQLSYVTSFVTEWYGWAAYHPDTSLYENP